MTPTAPARSNAVEANNAVAATLPDSRAMVERMAAIKARPRPRSAIRKRSQASASMLASTDFKVLGSRMELWVNAIAIWNGWQRLSCATGLPEIYPMGTQLLNFQPHCDRMLQ